MAVLAAARNAGIKLKLCGAEVRVAAFAPDPVLIEALRLHKPAIQMLCRASSDLGVRLSWSAAQLCIDDDPADSGYAAIHHFLRERLTRYQHAQQYGYPDGAIPNANSPYRSTNAEHDERMKA